MTNENPTRSTRGEVDTSTPRRSFHVLYVDPADDPSRVFEEHASPYPVTTITSLQAARDELRQDVDCLVLAADRSVDVGRGFLEYLRTERSELPVVLFGSTADPEVLETLVEMDTADIVPRTDAHAVPTASERDRLREQLDEYYLRSLSDVQKTVLEIARSLMGAAPDEIDIEIEWGLELIGRRLDADRCLVCTYEDGTLERTHCWSEHDERPAGPAQFPASSFPGFDTAIQSFEPYAIPSESVTDLDIEIPDGFVGTLKRATDHEAADETRSSHPYLQESAIESLLAVPIVVDWELAGVLAIEQETRRPWPRSLRQQVQTLGELVGHTLEREHRRRELARQNDRLERFTSVVSHDLRNPLNVLSGYAELAAETGDPAHIEDVIVSARRMETMIEDLLALARNGAELDDREPIDLDALVDDAWNGVDTASATLEKRQLGTVDGDPSRLRQVFENLFRNSVEHGSTSSRRETRADNATEPGTESRASSQQGDAELESTVTVRVEGTADGFAVEDDGPGIPREDREVVFREGYTDNDGTGLGLSIVEAVVETHDWSVTVDAGELGGARFRFVTDTSPSA